MNQWSIISSNGTTKQFHPPPPQIKLGGENMDFVWTNFENNLYSFKIKRIIKKTWSEIIISATTSKQNSIPHTKVYMRDYVKCIFYKESIFRFNACLGWGSTASRLGGKLYSWSILMV